MDGDGDLDIVSASPGDDTIAWYENDGASDPSFNGDEANETATLTLSNPTNATISDDTGILTITYPSLSINDVTASDANAANATFTVTLSVASAHAVTVAYASSNGTATAGADYTASNGTLTFAAGDTTKTFTVPVLADLTDEVDETVTLRLSNASNATISDATGTLTITDDDVAPSLSINDVTTSNENAANATFTVTLSADSGQTETVAYATSNGTATAGADYTASNGTLTFAAGDTTKTFTVPVLADSTDEADETVTLTLSSASNATISDATGTLTITDDDVPSLSINDVTAPNENAANATFTVTLSPASDELVTVAYATSNGTATAGADYTASNGTLTFAAGDTTKTFTVPVHADPIIYTDADQVRAVHVVDLSNDGYLDIISASTADDRIIWYEHDGNADPTWTPVEITTDVNCAWEIDVGDMDGDGDLDIRYTAFGGNRIGWLENNGAADPGWTKVDIASPNKPVDAKLADLDGDGDLDIVTAIWGADTISWYKNNGAADHSWTEASTAMSTNVDAPHAVKIADMDGDGDLDVVSASYGDDKIAWFENDGAEDPSFTAETIATSADGARDVYLADLDGDGHMDIISASEIDDTVAWYKNDGASNPTWTARDIAYQCGYGRRGLRWRFRW